MLLYDAEAAHTYIVRHFILERGNLTLNVQTIDIQNLENRRLKYRTTVNSHGEVPALRLDDNDNTRATVLTEVPAICGYLDEIAHAKDGATLFGDSAGSRATTQMWFRRVDQGICQPLLSWYRDDPASIDFYRGNRHPCPEAVVGHKLAVNRGLNWLDDELDDGRRYLCGDGARITFADIYLYGMLKMMGFVAGWVNVPGRVNVAAWMKRMDEREASQKALATFGAKVEVGERTTSLSV